MALGENRDPARGAAGALPDWFLDDGRRIESEFATAMGDPGRVAEACGRLRARIPEISSSTASLNAFASLLPLLRKRSGPAAQVLFDLLEEAAHAAAGPWTFLSSLLAAREPELRLRALRSALHLAQAGRLRVDLHVAVDMARSVSEPGSSLSTPAALAEIASLLGMLELPPPAADPDPVTALYLGPFDLRARRLAARLLDLPGEPAPAIVRERLLGDETHWELAPFLDYTRATHADLLEIAPETGKSPSCLPSLRKARALCGERLLGETIGAVGWPAVNLGLHASAYEAVSVDGSFPLLLSPAEARLLEGFKPAHRQETRILITAHGGAPASAPEESEGEGVIHRFRMYNLAHAEVLAEILSLAPLDRARVERLLSSMDRIVEDFVFLFARYEEECATLPAVYGELKARIAAELPGTVPGRPLSPELTRLTQMFEDPRNLGEVRTLHGLKRYLHQKGLRLGFRLVDTGRATNRSVDLILASPERVLSVASKIRYVDFEPEEEPEASADVPYPVRVVAEGFGRQLLAGVTKLPEVKAFCYGNEVHYYVAFGNHPAFVRIDYAPPLRGGMIDLEYYGVSKYELTEHPAPDLPAIRLFFRRLDFDAEVANTRIHARYDKERAVDMADLLERIEALFRLVPYLMDLDWVIGSLHLTDEARRDVTGAWCGFFLQWGVLPVDSLLTRDRQGILRALENDPAGGEREIRWSGSPPYQDRFTIPAPGGFLARLSGVVEERRLPVAVPALPGAEGPFGQIPLERMLLRALRDGLERGEIIDGPQGLEPAPTDRFVPLHEAECFAEFLASDAEDGLHLEKAIHMASVVAPLDRALRFLTTGSVNGHEVQRAHLTMRGATLTLFVLRDPAGIARLALAAKGPCPCRRRGDPDGGWSEDLRLDAAGFAALLRRNGYLTPGMEPDTPADPAGEVRAVRALFSSPGLHRVSASLPGEQTLLGVKAAPGRATGVALFGTAGRSPADLDGAILIAPSVSPEDNAFLYRCAGIVSTGGGILSHAGLLAVQFRKPALIVSGRWDRSRESAPRLLYSTLEFEEVEEQVAGVPVTLRRNIRQREGHLLEGDLVVLEAGEGVLRVLGKDRDALAFHEEMRRLREAARRLRGERSEPELLAVRGRRLRALHQIERLLTRTRNPVLAQHAIREILVGDPAEGATTIGEESAQLLRFLIDNPAVGRIAGDCALETANAMRARFSALRQEALRSIPESTDAYEVLSLRLEILRLADAIRGVERVLDECSLADEARTPAELEGIEKLAVDRFSAIAERLVDDLSRMAGGTAERRAESPSAAPAVPGRGVKNGRSQSAPHPAARHLLRQIDRLDGMIALSRDQQRRVEGARRRLSLEDEEAVRRFSGLRVVASGDAGLDLFDQIGAKAANLGEIDRLLGKGHVPEWFAVTDSALREALDQPIERDGPTAREAIEAILSQPETNDAQKSFLIRKLWEGIPLPEGLDADLIASYGRLAASQPAEEDPEGPFVAIRSSGREEDREEVARAGEFATFLFVRGSAAVRRSLRLAWAGLWTERAIHNRRAFGLARMGQGGGVIVQRIVRSRVAGVLQTVNVGEGRQREIVISAGLGLGEGIVSGTVGADQIVVAKGGDPAEGPLRFRYVTNDKREKVVFDEKRGGGTTRVESRYHERFRPALEYVEICELVDAARKIESIYGCPLDIEFAIEGTRLAILQVRPVVTFASVLRETRDRYPMRWAGQKD